MIDFYISKTDARGIVYELNYFTDMGLFFKKKKVTTVDKTVVIETAAKTIEKEGINKVAPTAVGKLDMVIAFDTTGSMACYIDDVRKQVSTLIPSLFRDNEDLRLGIVAFGDYCDMTGPGDFGDAYQCMPLTNNENDLIHFVNTSKNTSGGDGDEFYELVIKRIVEETQWREGSTRSILLIADARPHQLGYSCGEFITGNQIDWRAESRKAAEKKIKIDTVTIRCEPWYRELSEMTNGVSVPFHSGEKTAILVEAAVSSRGSMKSRMNFDKMRESLSDDSELNEVFATYSKVRDDIE